MNKKPLKLFTSFWRSQVASLIASVVDFGTLVFCVEILKMWYVLGTALGAVTGAAFNFFIGRHWSFQATEDFVHGQAFRYTLVSLGSLVLNSGGVYAVTETTGIPYWISRLIVSFLVGIFFNFTLHRAYVFRNVSTDGSKADTEN